MSLVCPVTFPVKFPVTLPSMSAINVPLVTLIVDCVPSAVVVPNVNLSALSSQMNAALSRSPRSTIIPLSLVGVDPV